MFDIFVPLENRLSKGNQAAFSEGLICPYCNYDAHKPSRFRFVNKPEMYRVRYQCKDCKRTLLYDFSQHEGFLQMYQLEQKRELSKLTRLTDSSGNPWLSK